jgi:Domain of unknown function (DUF4365)
MGEINMENLGPLPKSGRNAELHRLSIAALKAALPENKFVFREEPSEDAGVDGSLELLANGHSANLRSQVQLKATDSDKTNLDGSVSVSVDVSNLNHLLYGPSPLYVLYIAPRGELRFAWARDERKRLDQSTPGWLKQDSVTIRFHTLITPETLDHIYQRIGQEALFQRRVSDLVGTAGSSGQLVIAINPKTLNITDPVEAKRLLVKSGTAIITAGYVHQVKNLIRLLDPKDAREPRILLIQAHAESHLGRYKQAILYLEEASLCPNELSEDDQLFLRTLQDTCDFQIGRISMSEFSRRLGHLSQQDNSPFALSTRLQLIRYTLLDETEPAPRNAILKELRLLVESIVNSSDNSEAFKIHARICKIEADGHQLVHDSMQETREAYLKFSAGKSPDLQALFRSQTARLMTWGKEVSTLLKDALGLGISPLISHVMIIKGFIDYMTLIGQKRFSLEYGIPIQLSPEIIGSNIENAKQAAELCSQFGNLEDELRAKMLLADFQDLAGRQTETREIAQEVMTKAKVMGYTDLIWRAEQQLAGRSLQSLQADVYRPKSEQEKLIAAAQEGDELLRKNAVEMLRIHELPAEQLPIIERWYFSNRDVAHVRLGWCRHLDIEDGRRTVPPERFFERVPAGFCVCLKHGYHSNSGDPDWGAVIADFKNSNCERCLDRHPYGESPDVK